MSRDKSIWALIAIAIAFVILPTGTPEDIPTTFAIINYGGIELYKWLAVGSILLLMAIDK